MTVVSALAGVVPEEVLSEPDAARWAALGRVPEAVALPASCEEVAAIMEWASAERVRVVPAGSGRRLRAARGDERFIVIASDRLAGFEIYEPADLTFTAGAGTSLAEVDARIGPNGQWLPFDPPDVAGRTLGGLVALADSGPLATGYGALRNHVLGMTVVTGDGRTLHLGGRVVKNVAGFDLLKPLVGSRGRLALITSVCIRAFPVPAVDRVLVLSERSLGELVPMGLAVGTAPILPVSCVVRGARPRGGEAARAELHVRLHGAEATVDADRRILERHLGRRFEVEPMGGATSTARPDSNAPVELVISILPSRLPEAIGAIERVDPVDVTIDTYAARARLSLATADARAVEALRSTVEGLGGALAVERMPAGTDTGRLGSGPDEAEAALADGLARVFDPSGVLWRPDR